LPTVAGLSVRPQKLSADRGYDAQWLRNALRQWHIQSAIPRKNSANGRKRRRLTESAKVIFKNRWKVERGFAWLDGFRRLVTRWEFYPQIHHAFISVAIISILLR
jgi:transposase